MAKEQRVFGAGDVAKQLGISGPGLRRLAVVYERVYGELPRDDRGRLWPEEALARLQAARAAVGEGRAASTEAALRAGDDGEVVVDLDRRYPAPSKAADDRADAVEKLLEELRLLRGAVEGMSRRLATVEIENRKLREAVSVSRELEAPSEPRESFETPEKEHTRLEEEHERTRELKWEERERTRELQWQLIEVREQLEAERSKGFWRRLFGG